MTDFNSIYVKDLQKNESRPLTIEDVQFAAKMLSRGKFSPAPDYWEREIAQPLRLHFEMNEFIKPPSL